MILDRLRDHVCRYLCPHSVGHHNSAPEDRLNRAEQLHIMTAQTAAIENRRTNKSVGYMRVVANSAVDRLRHERTEVEESGKS